VAVFILVHGGCHGGWCYDRVASSLRSAGHEVHAPTLSGVGDRAHLAIGAINLSTHVEDIVSMIDMYNLEDVILCGHSYGGMVITGVADCRASKIASLVYLDGCVPEDGQSLLDIVRDTIGVERALDFIRLAGENGILMSAPPAAAFLQQASHAEIDRVDRLCTPHPIACFIQKLNRTHREGEVARRTYIRADRFHSLNYPTCERLQADGGWRIKAIDCGHDMMIDAPDTLAELLLEELGP